MEKDLASCGNELILLSFAPDPNQNPERNFGGFQPGLALPSIDCFCRFVKFILLHPAVRNC